jgi:acetylornithine/succinyldiaminopimelate/putrescine aminotransferase
LLSAYSALNQGHCHPQIVKALQAQAERVTLTSRAFRNDQLPLFCKELAQLCRMERVLPMNTGAEAVETAIKLARRWGYTKKKIPTDRAEIIVCRNNFHGRTTTLVDFPASRRIAAALDPSRRDLSPSPSATSRRWKKRSIETPAHFYSNRFRQKQGSCSLRRAICARRRRCVKSAKS